MRTSRSISFSSVRNATREPHAFYRTFLFFQSLHSVKRHAREYIYIYTGQKKSISKCSRRRERCEEKTIYFTSTTESQKKHSLWISEGSISGSTWRGDLVRSIDSGWLDPLVGTHRDEIRVEARAILAGRAERSEASSLRLFSASSREPAYASSHAIATFQTHRVASHRVLFVSLIHHGVYCMGRGISNNKRAR